MKENRVIRAAIARRLHNWSLMQARLRGGLTAAPQVAPGFRFHSSNVVRDGGTPPVLMGEAEETDQVMKSLSVPMYAKLRRALELQHVWKPPVHQRYAELGMRQRTYYRFVDSAEREFWKRLKALRTKTA